MPSPSIVDATFFCRRCGTRLQGAELENNYAALCDACLAERFRLGRERAAESRRRFWAARYTRARDAGARAGEDA